MRKKRTVPAQDAPKVEPKEEPKAEAPAPLHVETPPEFEPFEVCTEWEDGRVVKISTWRHEDGQTEQWRGNKKVYGPEPKEA